MAAWLHTKAAEWKRKSTLSTGNTDYGFELKAKVHEEIKYLDGSLNKTNTQIASNKKQIKSCKRLRKVMAAWLAGQLACPSLGAGWLGPQKYEIAAALFPQ